MTKGNHVLIANYFDKHKDLLLDGNTVDDVLYVVKYNIDDVITSASIAVSVKDNMHQCFRGISSSIDMMLLDVSANTSDIISDGFPLDMDHLTD